ncbi:DUF3089 domain-containing protein [Novosphingobium piscinae]|uniref:DUF3089 domain-containing protein n=1 Tax=Novosphingobium piscinae TaxID=1507448 RepID=A0A7X1FY48_9SPHN|nr:DUF3089 domain-containing protein [Novosphingobium piscinae]MBC2668462.1 DUF3089 domain-containing protein [Novosphingobium piscinae]
MARKFLYIVAVLIALVFLGRVALSFWGNDLARLALVPGGAYERAGALPAGAYADQAMWLSRPGLKDDPARFRPAGLPADPAPLDAAVFFIHPTSYIDRAHWNAPLDDVAANQTARRLVQALASAFNASPQLWAPRYRQATFGAFLTDRPDRTAALELAYGDLRQAFAAFLAAVPEDQPIVLVGHSQGALHLKRLLRDEVAGKPLARRIVAAYVIGWPVSLAHDLGPMGLPACASAAQTGCVLSWMSYAEPADTAETRRAYAGNPAVDGRLPGKSPMLCTNPLTWTLGTAAPASANRGTLVPTKVEGQGELRPGMVPARCGPEQFLLIGPPPEMGDYVLPGNNYHVYDIPLFWANVRANVAMRVQAWQAQEAR